MANISSRASGFWADDASSRRSASGHEYDDDEEVLDREEQPLAGLGADDPNDFRTPLDKTIDRIGMGSYQWALVSLCGFGWAADNMWIQAVAIILPRVQRHFSVPDSYIGVVSSSMFAGMMFGAVGWGTCSDLMGRSTAFNATLFFTAVFGLFASLANSLPALCVLLFLLGSSVGGSMPTDGTLLLEHMPQGKQYLVTALSVFFSMGSVVAAVVALLVVPRNSCTAHQTDCNVATDNMGWKYLLIALGLITLSMFVARIVFFRLHESPRYLVHAGRPQEAMESLRMISQFNGENLAFSLEDVQDNRPPPLAKANGFRRGGDDTENLLPPDSTKVDETEAAPANSLPGTGSGGSSPNYAAIGEAQQLEGDYSYYTPNPDGQQRFSFQQNRHSFPPARPSSALGAPRKSLNLDEGPLADESVHFEEPLRSSAPLRSSLSRRNSRRLSSASVSSVYERKVCGALPRWLRKPLWGWWERVKMVLTPEWLRVTLLVWLVWCLVSLAYTMFNVYLPKLLESPSKSPTSATGRDDVPAPAPGIKEKGLEETLWDVVIFTLGGCPGAIVGAYMVETRLGRRLSLALSTFVTAIFCILFIYMENVWLVRATTVGISLSSTTMWAVLYGWTPEIFGTEVRGTACGIASALSRIGGMIAPILGGVLLSIDRAIPVYTSIVVFTFGAICVLFLKEDDGDGARAKGSGERIIVH